jgi:hypothetical protein
LQPRVAAALWQHAKEETRKKAKKRSPKKKSAPKPDVSQIAAQIVK